uniref:Uncharacterized protein n=1 Tax=Nelumbo nucifera TaxID=4432 RepID=A0A822Y9K9_NELNU|nr:TPA_asm: hypothetical protein HUJ06_029709 [Nelumbo nucifera]
MKRNLLSFHEKGNLDLTTHVLLEEGGGESGQFSKKIDQNAKMGMPFGSGNEDSSENVFGGGLKDIEKEMDLSGVGQTRTVLTNQDPISNGRDKQKMAIGENPQGAKRHRALIY